MNDMRDRLIALLKSPHKAEQLRNMGIDIDNDNADTETIIADFLLANSVIAPPCKVGDTVYKICSVNSKIKFGDMWDGKIVKSNCDRCGYRNCPCYYIGVRSHEHDFMIDVIEPKKVYSLVFLAEIMPYFGTIWFTTKEAAEKALKTK